MRRDTTAAPTGGAVVRCFHETSISEHHVRYVGVRRLADILDFHPKTIERMARTGRIPASRIGSRWRFRLDNIESWLAERSL